MGSEVLGQALVVALAIVVCLILWGALRYATVRFDTTGRVSPAIPRNLATVSAATLIVTLLHGPPRTKILVGFVVLAVMLAGLRAVEVLIGVFKSGGH